MKRPNLRQRGYIALHLRYWYLEPRLDPNKPIVNEAIIIKEGLEVRYHPTEDMIDAYDIVLDWVDEPPEVV